MMKGMRGLVLCAFLLSACTHPQDSGVKVIVGAKLENGQGRTPLDYSVVIVADGKIQAAGPQSSTPVPNGAVMIRGLGMTLEPIPGGDPIEPGRPANLVLKGATERVMHNGEWVQ
jgi:hypothetical protein